MRFVLMLAALQEAAGGGSEIGFMEAYKKAPWFLTANMIVSVVVVTIVVERILFQLTKYRLNTKLFYAEIRKLVIANNIDRAIKLCEAEDFPILQLVKAGLTHANKTPDEIDAALSERYSELKPAIEKRIGSLWSLANIATLIGLLGTVTGLIATFAAVSAQGLGQAEKQRLLSLGIAEAMWNTAFGLGIAVACMIAHLFLSQRAKKLAHELESTMEKVFNLLSISNKSTGY